jgi:hypothetical protein
MPLQPILESLERDLRQRGASLSSEPRASTSPDVLLLLDNHEVGDRQVGARPSLAAFSSRTPDGDVALLN